MINRKLNTQEKNWIADKVVEAIMEIERDVAKEVKKTERREVVAKICEKFEEVYKNEIEKIND